MKTPPTTEAAVIRAYLRGDSVLAIAHDHAISHATVARIRRDAGLPVRRSGRPSVLDCPEARARYAELRAQGASTTAIARTLGVSWHAAYQWGRR